MKTIDITGEKFGRLTVVERHGSSNEGKATWLCRCDCGGDTVVIGKLLRSGNTRSCGCMLREAITAPSTHGMTYSPEYATWCRIKNRCANPKVADYPDYGGRGIKICDRWRDSFEAFFADMGPRPSPKHSVDRENNDGHYEPGNCRWATPEQQANNKRSNHFITAFGRTQTMAQWAREVGITRGALKQRLKRGWPLERALSEPMHP